MNQFICWIEQIFSNTTFQIVFSGVGGSLLGALVGVFASQYIEQQKYRKNRDRNLETINKNIEQNTPIVKKILNEICLEKDNLKNNRIQIEPFFKLLKPNWEIFFTTPPEDDLIAQHLRSLFQITEIINGTIESRENYRINNRGGDKLCSSLIIYNTELEKYLNLYLEAHSKLKKLGS